MANPTTGTTGTGLDTIIDLIWADTDLVEHISEEDIIGGIHTAICNRISAMMDRVGVVREVTMTGGVAKNTGIVKIIEQKVGSKINVPYEPQIIGALGAALIAGQQVKV